MDSNLRYLKKIISLLFLLSIYSSAYGQDIDSIRLRVTADKDAYSKTLEKFIYDYGNIDRSEIQYIYYGFAFMPQYNGNFDMFSDMYSALNAQDREKAWEEAQICESQNPVCLELLWKLVNLADDTKQDSYIGRFALMLAAVISSGDGRTPDTAYKVIRTGDEYVILQFLYKMSELETQTALEGDIDMMEFITADGKEMTLFFDRSLPSARDVEILSQLLKQ